jgi:transposase-like protein
MRALPHWRWHLDEVFVKINASRITFGALSIRTWGLSDNSETGRWLNSRAENSHQPFRRRKRAMLRFRRMLSLQKFAAVRSSIYNLFNAKAPSRAGTPSRPAAPPLSPSGVSSV